MDKEICKKIIKLSDEINQLSKFQKRIQENDDASFSLRFVKYFLKCKSQYIQEPVVIDQNVSPIIISILNKHLKEIKNEIQEEIDKRNMEIEEL